jgi:hypothetical protein
MFESTGNGKRVSRRGFLRGTAGFAAAAAVFGAASVPGAAQQQEPAPVSPGDAGQGDAARKGDAEDKAKGGPEQPPKKKLVDKDGREYRICDMCGGNMYKQEKTWTCEQCGFSYDE